MSVPVAVAMIASAWTSFTRHSVAGGTVAFLCFWTAGIIAIETFNFRTMYLGRGRRAEAMTRALDAQGVG